MAAANDESVINIDGLDLEDKLKWLKEILENGRERFGQLESNGSLVTFIDKLAVRNLSLKYHFNCVLWLLLTGSHVP